MIVKILGIGDMANSMLGLQKCVKDYEIHIIDFIENEKNLPVGKNFYYFESSVLKNQVKEINSIKHEYEFFIVTGWRSALIAYLAGLKFVFYFLGTDIREPPFEKNVKTFYERNRLNKFNALERFLYRKVFDSSLANVTSFEEKISNLNKYDSKAYRIDRVYFDQKLFSGKILPTNKIKKKKFTFFSPSRIDKDKGFDILWKAIKYCKTDFEIIQIDWFRSHESSEKDKEMFIKTKPQQITLIPQISRKEMAEFYVASDAVIGSFGVDYPENVAVEGVLCKKPVISYSNPNTKFQFGEVQYTSPFLPASKDPKDLADVIDNIVTSKSFREELLEKELKFVEKEIDPRGVSEDWNNFLSEMRQKSKSKSNLSRTKILIRWVLFYSVRVIEKLRNFNNKR